MSNPQKKLEELSIKLPAASKPAANYVSYIQSGNQIIISGQLPFQNGSLDNHKGKLGADCSIEKGKEAAKLCAINLLAQAADATGGKLEKLRCLKLGVFVNSSADFTEHPAVANGASDFLAAILGDNGKHARAAVGVASLPFGVAVEVEAIFEII